MRITSSLSTNPIIPQKTAVSAKQTSVSPQAAGDGFSRTEQRELDKWKDRLRFDMGTLTTPPAGEQDPKMEQARGYLVDLLDKLAGPEITKSGIDLQVELFTGDVPQAAFEDDMGLEKNWKSSHRDQEWPIRRWIGVPDSHKDKPIYRLAVNVGMLNTLETEDELAFILAHQAERLLDHAKLDPDNEDVEGPNNKSFVDSRDMQVAADKAAIKRISEAGYNPRAALKALNTLYSKNPIEYPEKDLERALLAAAHNQEAEGMRVGAAQTEVEDYVRRGDPTASQEMKPLPGHLKIEVRANYDKPVDDIEAFKGNFRGLAEQLATDETPAWMFDSWSRGPREYYQIQQAGGDRQDQEEALTAAAQHLDQLEGKTPQQKVDGMLRLMLSLRHSALPKESFTADTIKTLRDFMGKYGSDWNADSFVDSLARGSRSLHFSFVDSMIYKRNFQDMAAGQLPGIGQAATRGWLTRTYSEPQPTFLTSLVRNNHKDDRETWPLAKEMNEAALSALSGFDYTEMLGKTGGTGLSKATEFANDLFGLDEPSKEFMARLREAGTSLADQAGAARESRARVRLQLPLQEPKKINQFLVAFGKTESWKEFSPEFETDFRQLLRDFITVSVQQPGFVADEREADGYSHGIERRIVEEMKTSDNPSAALTHLSRHLLPSRRVRAHTERRAWLGEAAREVAKDGIDGVVEHLTKPDRSQHSSTIKQVLTSAYQLKPEDLPDTTTPSLSALNKRVQAGEFEPKREDFQSEAEYRRARTRYFDGQRDLRETLRPITTIESRGVLSKMALLGHDQELSGELTEGMQLGSFVKVMQGAEEALERFKVTTGLYKSEDEEDVGTDAGAFLMDGFLAVQEQIDGLDQWHDLASRSIDFSDGALNARVGTKRKLGDNLFGRLEGLEQQPLKNWLAKEKTLDLLSADQSSDLLVECLGDDCAPGADPTFLADKVAKLEKRYDLIEKYPVAYLGFRDKVAEKAKLQPSTVDTVFPEVVRGVTDTSDVYRKNARSLAGLVAIAREKSPQEQLDTIEYLMGRIDEMPAYLEEASEDQSFAPFRETLETTRQDLLEADNQTRVMIANSFLAGPSGVLRTEEGKQATINHFLKNLKDENRELGEKIAHGVLYSHGDADTLAVAYILGQAPEEPKEGQDPGEKGKLDEAAILNRLFDAYGVPGIKMKQYLAFTSEFKDFKEAFESAQDASMPLNYYQVLKLVQNRFGDEWPQDLKIDRVLGSGSVNVAIRYRNEKTGKREVVSLGRQDIEESTAYDFDRFNKLIEHMTRTPEDKEKYGYVLGLLDIINDSVALEFKKDQAMEVQQMAKRTYNHDANGWHVQSIDAFRVENLGLFMEEAKGKTARKIYNKDQDVYNEAMDAMAAAEFGVLRGVDSTGNWKPVPLFANPDFHDGQVLIDEDNKTVTILDFGQAVPISNDDRNGGLDLLTVIGKADSAWWATRRLNKRYFPDGGGITKEQLAPILEREDRMDCFIHLLSLLSRNGGDVPLSSVHWVLGMNRQMALAEKIGDPIDTAVRNMILNHKSGLPLSTFNASYGSGTKLAEMGKQAASAALNVTRSAVGVMGGWFGVELFNEPQTVVKQPKPRREAKYKAWRPKFS